MDLPNNPYPLQHTPEMRAREREHTRGRIIVISDKLYFDKRVSPGGGISRSLACHRQLCSESAGTFRSGLNCAIVDRLCWPNVRATHVAPTCIPSFILNGVEISMTLSRTLVSRHAVTTKDKYYIREDVETINTSKKKKKNNNTQ